MQTTRLDRATGGVAARNSVLANSRQFFDAGHATLAPELDPGHDHGTVAERLEDLGLSPTQVAEAEAMIAAEASVEARHMTAEALLVVARRLKAHSSASCAVALALGLRDADPESLGELAGALGCSKQNLHQIVARVAPAFADLKDLRPQHAQRLVSRTQRAAVRRRLDGAA